MWRSILINQGSLCVLSIVTTERLLDISLLYAYIRLLMCRGVEHTYAVNRIIILSHLCIRSTIAATVHNIIIIPLIVGLLTRRIHIIFIYIRIQHSNAIDQRISKPHIGLHTVVDAHINNILFILNYYH